MISEKNWTQQIYHSIQIPISLNLFFYNYYYFIIASVLF